MMWIIITLSKWPIIALPWRHWTIYPPTICGPTFYQFKLLCHQEQSRMRLHIACPGPWSLVHARWSGGLREWVGLGPVRMGSIRKEREEQFLAPKKSRLFPSEVINPLRFERSRWISRFTTFIRVCRHSVCVRMWWWRYIGLSSSSSVISER